MTNQKSITAKVDRATEVCTLELANFIGYIQKLDPEIKGYQAIMVAAKILNQLPDAFENNSEMLDDLKTECQLAKTNC